jgi:hypothetical protein
LPVWVGQEVQEVSWQVSSVRITLLTLVSTRPSSFQYCNP